MIGDPREPFSRGMTVHYINPDGIREGYPGRIRQFFVALRTTGCRVTNRRRIPRPPTDSPGRRDYADAVTYLNSTGPVLLDREEVAMKLSILTAVALIGWLGVAGVARSYETAVVFLKSQVQHVDARNQLLTFKTKEGQTWTLHVADGAAIKRDSLAKGDVVSIEVDLDDQIVKIVKVAEPTESMGEKSRNR